MTGVASSTCFQPTGGEAGGEMRNCLSGLGGARCALPMCRVWKREVGISGGSVLGRGEQSLGMVSAPSRQGQAQPQGRGKNHISELSSWLRATQRQALKVLGHPLVCLSLFHQALSPEEIYDSVQWYFWLPLWVPIKSNVIESRKRARKSTVGKESVCLTCSLPTFDPWGIKQVTKDLGSHQA